MFIIQKIKNARVKIREKLNPIFAPRRRKKLHALDFTIISNNCWGGHVYRYFGLPYNSLTVGLFFYSEDFIKFCKKLKHYVESSLTFIDISQSKYKNDLEKHNINCPIGKIDDIEIIFLHYKTKEEAKEKWIRRCARINYDNLIFKMSYQNLCNEEFLKEFDNLDEKRKIVFVTKDYDLKSQIIWKGRKNIDGENIRVDTIEFKKYINLYDLINGNL